jgi:hypothetical protein
MPKSEGAQDMAYLLALLSGTIVVVLGLAAIRTKKPTIGLVLVVAPLLAALIWLLQMGEGMCGDFYYLGLVLLGGVAVVVVGLVAICLKRPKIGVMVIIGAILLAVVGWFVTISLMLPRIS